MTEKIRKMSSRSLNYINNDVVVTFNENTLVIDNGCAQKIVNISAFLIETFAGIKCNVGGALNSMKSTKLELVNDTYTIITLPNNVNVILKLTRHFWIQVLIKQKHFFSLTR